jgi:hypothetical protein
LLGTKLQYYHQRLFSAVVSRFNEELKQARLKDMERLTFAMGLFDFKSQDGMEKEVTKNILLELKLRVQEIMKYPRCLAAIAHFLTILGVHDVDIIKSVLTKDFIDLTYGESRVRKPAKFIQKFFEISGKNRMKIGHEVLCLDSFTRINLKSSYDGPQLDKKLRALITKHESHYVPYRDQPYKLTHSDLLILNVKEYLEVRYGPNNLRHILPHFERPDIIYCFNENNESVTDQLVDIFPPLYAGEILSKEFLLSRKPEFAENMDKYKMVAVVVGGWNLYIRNTDIPTGGLRLKIDQLKMIGYKPILIHWHDWRTLSGSDKDQLIKIDMKRALA